MHHSFAPLDGRLGEPLPDTLRMRMERAFGADFRDVRVHHCDTATRINRRLGSIACTDGRRIAFLGGEYRPHSEAGRWLIAHELAHVVQKRAGLDARAGIGADHETEASAAADAIHAGRPVPALSPDSDAELRTWQEEGHYFTVYYVAAAAGIEKRLAGITAMRAQIPDEVVELDATDQGFNAGAHLISTSFVLSQGGGLGALFDGPVRRRQEKMLKDATLALDVARMVQRGVHCLNGNNGETETRFRAGVLRGGNIEDFGFGLALHALGDSFSHREPNGRMFSGLTGHLRSDPGEDIDHDDAYDDRFLGKCIDHIHRRPAMYRDYVVMMYDILCEQAVRRNEKPRALRKEVETFAEKVARLKSKLEQAHLLRTQTGTLLKTHGMDFELDSSGLAKARAVPWAEYVTKFAGNDPQATVKTVDKLFSYAREWDRGNFG